MKKYIACLLIVVLTIVSCKEETIPKPDNLLSKDKMAAILYDVTLVNSIKGVNKKKLEEGYMHLDTYLYKKHDTDSLQFLTSNNYYAANPDKYSEIYGMVQARLTKERKKIGEELEAEQKRRDSVQKSKKLARTNKKKDSIAKSKPKPKFNEVESDG
ncbi:DUF4296 domain-containing protein [uncultured Kordia sp.]|uniref:DUF4296 domain-containing protein n=1 Tax=uncultured Kordia sp. TaxID=507699 RepID=UPI00260A53F9|nr:DUF4296 domain-containing protein [uncultured Kordia sp.]